MYYLKKIFIPFLTILVCAVVFHIFRVIPATKLWKNFTVLYVQSDVKADNVINLLKDNGISEFYCLENQKIPLDVSEKSPEAALSLAGMSGGNYLERRNLFFFDKARQVKLYYIPEVMSKNTGKVCDELKQAGYSAGINTKSAYPLAAVIVFAAFSVFLICFSSDRKLSVMLSVMPIFFLLNVPFYSVAAGICLLQLVFFFFVRIYNREGAESVLIRNLFLMAFAVSAGLLMISSSIKFVLFYLMLLCSEYCVIELYRQLQAFFNSRYSFHYVNIRNAKLVPLYTRRNIFVLPVASLCCLLILLSSFVSFNFGETDSSRNLQLPSSSGSGGKLPSVDDYVNWKWDAMTFPYRNLNAAGSKKPDGSDTVYFKSYNTKNGLIEETVSSITFNDQFKKDAVDGIDSFKFPAIEKVMKEQGNSKSFGYSSSGSQSVNFLSIIFMVFSFVIPFVFYLNFRRWR